MMLDRRMLSNRGRSGLRQDAIYSVKFPPLIPLGMKFISAFVRLPQARNAGLCACTQENLGENSKKKN